MNARSGRERGERAIFGENTQIIDMSYNVGRNLLMKLTKASGPVARANLAEGHSEPHPNIMGPSGILELFILGSK